MSRRAVLAAVFLVAVAASHADAQRGGGRSGSSGRSESSGKNSTGGGERSEHSARSERRESRESREVRESGNAETSSREPTARGDRGAQRLSSRGARAPGTKSTKPGNSASVEQRTEQVREFASQAMKSPEVEHILQKIPENPRQRDVNSVASDVRTEVVGQMRAQELAKENPRGEVLRDVEVYEKQPMSVEEFRAASREAKQGLTLREGKNGEQHVYKRVTDVDALVLDRPLTPGQKSGMTRLEQVKTGQRDTPGEAASQNHEAARVIQAGASEAGKVILEHQGRNITEQVDLGSVGRARSVTVGPEGKGFNESLGVTAGGLERAIKDAIADAKTRKEP
jgi:hypothetical protein